MKYSIADEHLDIHIDAYTSVVLLFHHHSNIQYDFNPFRFASLKCLTVFLRQLSGVIVNQTLTVLVFFSGKPESSNVAIYLLIRQGKKGTVISWVSC